MGLDGTGKENLRENRDMSKKIHKLKKKSMKPLGAIKPVKAWALLNSLNEIQPDTTFKTKSTITDICNYNEGDKVIRVEIRAI